MGKFRPAAAACLALGVSFVLFGGCNVGGMEITPVSSRQTNDVGQVPPADGELFIVADLKLGNSGSDPLPLSSVGFTITSTGGIQYLANALTDVVPGGCRTGASLASGGSTRCTVVFSAPASTRTRSISYKNPSDPNASPVEVPLDTKACTLCGSACVDLTSDANNCGQCGHQVGAGTCNAGVPTCDQGADKCDGSTCTSLTSDPSNCGACGNAVPQGYQCVNGQQSCPSSLTDCGGYCAATMSNDINNCGSCGRKCPGGYADCSGSQISTKCQSGVCYSQIKSSQQMSCDAICGAQGLTCHYGSAGYSPVGCYEIGLMCNQTPPSNENAMFGGSAPFTYVHCECQG